MGRTTWVLTMVWTLCTVRASAQEGGARLAAPPVPDAPATARSTATPATDKPVARARRGVESRIRLRPVDKATVRIVAVGGADATAFESHRTGTTRVAAIPRAVHGTGVAISADGLVLTARHVTWGSDAVAVILPGTDHPIPARVVYIDPNHDLAFLKAQAATPDHITLPSRPHPLVLSERVSASGYPLDIRQRYPAAVSGEVSRENNDGSLQIAMSVNPGNSGGPVIDDDGNLIGIMSKRGEPRAGVAGIALIEPLRFVLLAYSAALEELKRSPPRFHPTDGVLAQVLADFVRTTDERPIYEQTTIPTLRAAAAGASSPETTMIVAAHAWNMHIALLEARRRRTPDELSGQDRVHAEQLLRTAMQLSQQALGQAPYLRFIYPIARSIVNSQGRSYVPPEP